jgi:hypothetical protein
MPSNSSKPSSDAGFQPIGEFSPIGTPTAQTSSKIQGSGLSFFDKQTAAESQPSHLTGRHKAPTGVPTSTKVLVGGEETPSRQIVANQGGIPLKCLARHSLHFRFIPNCNEPNVVSFHKNHEGIFFYLWPFELALLRPGVQS